MPREQQEWFTKDSEHQIHARQSCSYSSIINVNKSKYPFFSSYEQEQTWTLTRTMSNNHKRYQSSIENIHLTMPITVLKTKQTDYENIPIQKNQPIVVFSSTKLPCSAFRSASTDMSSIERQEQKISVMKPTPISMRKSRALSKPMRVIHSNGEFVVRI